MSVKRIVFVIPAFEGGGAERVFLSLLAHLDTAVYDPVVICFNKTGALVDALPARIRVIDLRKSGPLSLPVLIWRLRNVLRRESPRLVVSFITYANYITIAARILSGVKIPVIVAEHSVVSRTISGWSEGLKRKIISFFYPRADAVITVSRGCKDELVREYWVPEKKITVIPNGIDLDLIRLRAAENVADPWFCGDIPVIVTIGRLTKAKALPLLLRAVALVKKTQQTRLAIIGEGPERKSLCAYAKELGIQDSVRFLGFQNNPYKFLAKSSLFALSSAWESFSLVIIEAMCLGVPVVATDCPYGPGDIVTPGINGILAPVNDYSGLADAISRVIQDGELRKIMSENGKARANDFDLIRMVLQYQQVFSRFGEECNA